MAKNKMKLKVKPVKREKKQVVTYEPKDEVIEFLKETLKEKTEPRLVSLKLSLILSSS